MHGCLGLCNCTFFPCHWNPLNWTQRCCSEVQKWVSVELMWCLGLLACVSAEGPVLTELPGGSGPARSQKPAPSCRPAPQTPPSCTNTRTTSLTHLDFITRTIVWIMNVQGSTHWRSYVHITIFLHRSEKLIEPETERPWPCLQETNRFYNHSWMKKKKICLHGRRSTLTTVSVWGCSLEISLDMRLCTQLFRFL